MRLWPRPKPPARPEIREDKDLKDMVRERQQRIIRQLAAIEAESKLYGMRRPEKQ